MGKVLIIKDADFSANSFDSINIVLPAGYKNVSSIFNTGEGKDSGFDTGIYMTPNYSVAGSFAFSGNTQQYVSFFVDYLNDTTKMTRLSRKALNNNIIIWSNSLKANQGIEVNVSSFDIDTTQPNKYEIKGLSLFINNNLVSTQALEPISTPNNTTMKTYVQDIVIYGSFTIKDEQSGDRLFYGIPCVRESDDYAGLYDLVSNSFISNGYKNHYEE